MIADSSLCIWWQQLVGRPVMANGALVLAAAALLMAQAQRAAWLASAASSHVQLLLFGRFMLLCVFVVALQQRLQRHWQRRLVAAAAKSNLPSLTAAHCLRPFMARLQTLHALPNHIGNSSKPPAGSGRASHGLNKSLKLDPSTWPAYRSCRSSGRPIGSNHWTPPQLTNVNETCSSGTTTSGSPSTASPGSSSSGGKEAADSQGQAGGAGSSSAGSTAGTGAVQGCTGGRSGGGWDDSDEGGGGDKRFYKLAKSHSLDAPDPAVPSSSSATADSCSVGKDAVQHCPVEPQQQMACTAIVPAGGAAAGTPCAGTTGPWKLASPFAAMPAGSNDWDTCSHHSEQDDDSAQAVATTSPQQPPRQASLPETEAAVAPEPKPTGEGGTAAALGTVTGPWRLASPFAAALAPAFSDAAASVANQLGSHSPAAAGDSRCSSGSGSGSAGSSRDLPTADSGGDQLAVAARVDRGRQVRQQQKAAAAAAAAAGVGKKGLAALDAKIAAADHVLRNCGLHHVTDGQGRQPKPKQSGLDKAHKVSKEGRKPQQHREQQAASPKGTTGPWGLHSPFAAAATPFDGRSSDDNPAAQAGLDSVSSKESSAAGSSSIRSDSEEAASAGTAGLMPVLPDSSAASASKQIWSDPFGSPLPVAYEQLSQAAAEARGQVEQAATALSQQTGPPKTGPWGLSSPFAGFSTAAGFGDSSADDEDDAVTYREAPESSSRRTADAAVACVGQRSHQAADDEAGRCSCSSLPAKQAASSSGAGSDPRYSFPCSLPSGISGSSGTAVNATSGCFAGVQELADLESQPTSLPDWMVTSQGLDSVPSDAEMVLGSFSHTNTDLVENTKALQEGRAGWGLEVAATATAHQEPSLSLDGTSCQQNSSELPATAADGDLLQQHGKVPLPRGDLGGPSLYDSVGSHLLKQQAKAPPASAVPSACASGFAAQPAGQSSQQATPGRVPQEAGACLALQGLGGLQQPPTLLPAVTPAPTATLAGTSAPVAAVGQAASTLAAALPAVTGTPQVVVPAVPAAAAAAAAGAAVCVAGEVPAPAYPAAGTLPALLAQQSITVPAPALQPAVIVAGNSSTVSPRGSFEVAGSAQPGPAAIATAPTVAPVSRVTSISCLCCYPPCLTEALPTEVHLHVAGLDQLAVQAAGTLDTYRVVAFHGSTAVAEVRGLIQGSDGLLRVPLPALPKGVLQLALMVKDLHLCFVQPLLVIPRPCAQEMVLLWARLLQARLTAAAAAAQQQASCTPQGSFDISCSSWTSQDSDCSLQSNGSLPHDAPAGSRSAGGVSSATQQANLQATAAMAGATAGSRAAADPCKQSPNPSSRVQGPLAVSISQVEVQAVWQRQYMPVITDVAYLLAANMEKGATTACAAAAAVPAADPACVGQGSSNAGSPQSSPQGQQSPGLTVNTDSSEFKALVTHLVQFLAAHGMWAVLQLITDHVYGVGASAKALYAAKAGSSSSKINSGRTSSSGLAGCAAATAAAAAAAANVRRPVSVGGSSAQSIASGVSSEEALSARLLQPGQAVAAAITAARVGELPDLKAVFVLAWIVLQAVVYRKVAKVATGCLQACELAWQEPGAAAAHAGSGLAASFMCVLQLLGWLVQLPRLLIVKHLTGAA